MATRRQQTVPRGSRLAGRRPTRPMKLPVRHDISYLATLPSPILANILSDEKVATILDMCQLNKDLNQRICQSGAFWSELARRRGIPLKKYQGKSIRVIQELLRRQDRIYNIDKVFYTGQISRNPIVDETKLQLRKHFALSQHLTTLFTALEELYAKNYVETPGLVNPDEFSSRLADISSEVKNFDIIHITTDPFTYDYMVYHPFPDTTVLYHVDNGYLDNAIAFHFIQHIYQLNGNRPFTDDDIERLYGVIKINGFFVDQADKHAVTFGGKGDPLALEAGIIFYYDPDSSEDAEYWADDTADTEEELRKTERQRQREEEGYYSDSSDEESEDEEEDERRRQEQESQYL